jgi:uncharacterized protein YndB with AHSA1/START domain
MATGAAQGYETLVTLFIKATPAADFGAWATPDKLNSWFTHDAQQKFEVGGSFINGDGDSGEFLLIEPDKAINFTWNSKHHHPGSDVLVTFTPEDEGSFVSLLHRNLSSEKDADDLEEGWSWALDSLKSYLETGKKIGFEEWKTSRG